MVKVVLQECRCRFFPVLKGYIFYASIGQHGLQQDTEYRALAWMVGLVVIMNAVICVCCYKPVIRYGICYEGRAVLKRRDAEQ